MAEFVGEQTYEHRFNNTYYVIQLMMHDAYALAESGVRILRIPDRDGFLLIGLANTTDTVTFDKVPPYGELKEMPAVNRKLMMSDETILKWDDEGVDRTGFWGSGSFTRGYPIHLRPSEAALEVLTTEVVEKIWRDHE